MSTAIAAPERGAGRGAQHVRVGERVADDALERRAGDRQARPDEHRGEDPRHAQVPHDRLGRGRPRVPGVDAEQAPEDDADRCRRG